MRLFILVAQLACAPGSGAGWPVRDAQSRLRWDLDDLPVHTCSLPPDDVLIVQQLETQFTQYLFNAFDGGEFWAGYFWSESWVTDLESGSSAIGANSNEIDMEASLHFYVGTAKVSHPANFQGEQTSTRATPNGDVPYFDMSATINWNGDLNGAGMYSHPSDWFMPAWFCLSVIRQDRLAGMARFDPEGSFFEPYMPGRMLYLFQSVWYDTYMNWPETTEHHYRAGGTRFRETSGHYTYYSETTADRVWSMPLDGGEYHPDPDTGR